MSDWGSPPDGGVPPIPPSPPTPPPPATSMPLPPWAAAGPTLVHRPAAAPPLEGRARTVVRVELAVMAFAAAAPNLVAGLIGLREPQSVEIDISTLEVLVSVLLAFGPASVVVFLLWRDGMTSAAGFGSTRPAPLVGFSLLSWVLALVGSYTVGLIVFFLEFLATGDEPDRVTPSIDATLGVVIVAVVFSLTAGITEETVYRGYAITRMEQAGWPRAALVVPLLVWTLQHLYQGPTALPIVAVIGAGFVWLYWWRRSVWPLMIGHALYDATAFVIAILVS
ncbi:MAG: CPBP family intramembrane glutamic endopeptidase [Acidimicrobiales bacterium]